KSSLRVAKTRARGRCPDARFEVGMTQRSGASRNASEFAGQQWARYRWRTIAIRFPTAVPWALATAHDRILMPGPRTPTPPAWGERLSQRLCDLCLITVWTALT